MRFAEMIRIGLVQVSGANDLNELQSNSNSGVNEWNVFVSYTWIEFLQIDT